jgi:serine/threonine protein kinase
MSHVVRAPFASRLLVPSTYTVLVHRWLHDHPGILHRDPSPNNIMCRIIEEPNAAGEPSRKVYGVLTDYDLSSWTVCLKNDYTKTSQQRTGTPPYMAQELLVGTSATHLYRHDLESLFYVMLLTCGRHELANEKVGSTTGPRMVMRGGYPPYQGWFKQQHYGILGNEKWSFLTRPMPIELSPCFKDFRAWLRSLQLQFAAGFALKTLYGIKQGLEQEQSDGTSAGEVDDSFDDETLGNKISYSSFIEPIRRLSGELKGLIIRYDPKAIPLPLTTPTGAPTG